MTFFETKNKEDCNGCGVCKLKCPQNAIEMLEDDEGFLYPIINNKLCNNCGLCKKICPNHDYEKNKKIKTYIAINNDKNDVKKSTSGGIFFILARYVIKNHGVVFGVKYNDKLEVVHDSAMDLNEARKFQGSKYVRSNLNNTYKKIKEFLDDDRFVLFTGTPCQCQGLRTYLGKEYKKLIICDIICHANPSPKIFNLYKKNIELKNGKKIKTILFRNKERGWHYAIPTIIFNDGTEITDSTFYNAFSQELINRPSCHNCHFCSCNRLSDFTIGDSWGIEKICPNINDDNTGISLLSVNTEKAFEILELIKNEMYIKLVDTEKAYNYNHHSNNPMNDNRIKFFGEIRDNKIDEKNIIKKLKKYSKRKMYKRINDKIVFFVKKIKKNK